MLWGSKQFPVLAIVGAAVRRLSANIGLALCALIALLAAVALSVSIPVYAEGASLRLLEKEIARKEQQSGRSAFALLFRYVGAWNEPLEWEQVSPADTYLTGVALERLGLPLDGLGRHARTDQMQLFHSPSSGGNSQRQFLKNVSLGFVSGLDAQITIVDGERPQPAASIDEPIDEPIEVMIMRELADTMGINVGESFTLVAKSGGDVVSLPIQIVGLWEPVNASDPAWFFQPDAFREVILVDEATFTGPVAASLKNEVGQILWFIRLNGQDLSVSGASPLLSRIEQVRAQAAGLVQGLKLEQSPADALAAYRKGAADLTQQLAVLSVPMFGLVLYFASLVAAMLVNRQRGEIALLKTRGMRSMHILAVAVVEWCIMGAVALAIGPTIGLVFANLMGRTVSFLALSPDMEPLEIMLTARSLSFGAGAVLLTIGAALLPSLFATRRTLVDEQQQAARTQRPPFWQRFYLDFLLMIPPVYGIYQLQQREGGAATGANPLSDPLPSLIPVFFCFAGGLFAVRGIPILLELLARLAKFPSWTAPLVALRSLARQPASYRGALLLLILTLSLAAFSASMAATLDGSLHRAIQYQVGAMTQLIETGQSTEQQGSQTDQDTPPEHKDIEEEARFLFIPVAEHLEVPGIEAVARVGEYQAAVQLGGINQNAQLIGLDRLDFPSVVAYFDPRWSGGESLGSLMNRLAQTPEGVIVSRAILEKGLSIGDTLPATLELYGDRRQVKFVIVAVVDLWPATYPQDGPMMIANLDYIFDQMGGRYPYNVWIARDPQAQVSEIVQGVREQGFTVIDTRDAATMIRNEQMHPRRQGLFGLLSVGFIAAGLLTLLGFLLSALINARQRAIEMGVLQALGMSGVQVAVAITIEQVLLVVAGLGAGTGIGLLAAKLVVPLYQVGVGPHPGTPSYPPQIAWDEVTLIYAVFGVALLLTLVALAWVLARMRLFQAVKLGDVN